MYEIILIFSTITIVALFLFWVYSEKTLDGKYSKLISTISFPFPLIALYAVFKLNISFGFILVGLTVISAIVWFLSSWTDITKLKKESRSFFLILLAITIFRSFIYEPFQIPTKSMVPQIQVGDFLLVDKFSYGLKNPIGNETFVKLGSPKRGDVIVFTPKHTVCSSNLKSAYPESLDLISNQQRFNWQRYDNP